MEEYIIRMRVIMRRLKIQTLNIGCGGCSLKSTKRMIKMSIMKVTRRKRKQNKKSRLCNSTSREKI